MTRYSVQARDWTFVKSDEFLSFAKNMSRYIGKNISKNLRSKYSQNVTDHAKNNLVQMYLKLHQKEPFKNQKMQLVI